MDFLLLLPRLLLGGHALHDLPQQLPPDLGHRLARLVGLDDAYAFFCDHCPDEDLWQTPPAPATSLTDRPRPGPPSTSNVGP